MERTLIRKREPYTMMMRMTMSMRNRKELIQMMINPMAAWLIVSHQL